MSEPLYDATFRARLLRQGLSSDEMADFVRVVEAERDALRAELAQARTEVTSQMQAKLDAQRTLLVIVEALDLRLADLGDGWLEAAPKILARIETIVDGERPRTLLGWILGSDQAALDLIRRLHLEAPLLRIVNVLNRFLKRIHR